MPNTIKLKQLDQAELSAFVQEELDGTGAVYTADRALISNGIGDIVVSPVTSTELGRVAGVTSAIQTQLDAKFTLPSLTSGSVLFSNGTTIAQDNSNLFWDDTNNTLSIGQNSLPSGLSFLSSRNSTDVVGTISNSAGGTTVTGVGTAFLRTFQLGDLITANGETRTVLSIASDTSLTTDTWTGANSSVSYTVTSLGAGRITTSAGGTTVTGTGTNFLTQFVIGDTLKANGETRTVTSITSNTSMTTDTWIGANTTVSYEVFKKILFGITKSGYLFCGNTGPSTFTSRVNYDLLNAGTAIALSAAVVNAQTSIATSTSNQLAGGSYTATIGARNTQNWTSDFALSGLSGTISSQSGATGTINSAKAARLALSSSASGITITNVYGLNVFDSFVNSGTITNTYGVYVSDITSGTQTNTPYSFYASDANAIGLYSAGKIGVNQTAPTGMLDVIPASSSTIGVIVKGAASQTANLTEWQNSSATVLLSVSSGGNLVFAATNIATDTTTGTKIGTATSQKFSIWNATPIVQPTTAGAAATFVANTSLTADDTATWDGYTIGQVVKALRNFGLLA